MNAAGLYHAEIRDINNCTDRDTVMVTANPNPLVSLGPDRILNPDLGIFETLDAGPGYTTYKWDNGQISQSINVNAAGTYSVRVSDKKGCSASDTIVVRYWKKGDVNSVADIKVKIFPNPANDLLNIVSEKAVIENLVVYSLTGQVIYNQQPNSSETAINTSEWANGVYTVGITVEGKTSNVKVVVQH